jgi:hypothetical protein
LTIGEQERAQLMELLQVRFRPPAFRNLGGDIRGRIRRVRRALQRTFARGWERARHPIPPRLTPDEALSPSERALIAALRKHAVFGEKWSVRFANGDGPVRTHARLLVLPRRNRLVIAAVEQFSGEPASLYPIALALYGHRVEPCARVREAWYEGLAGAESP